MMYPSRQNSTSLILLSLVVLLFLVGCSKFPYQELSLEETCTRIADASSPSKLVCFRSIAGRAIIEGDIDLGKTEDILRPKTKSGREALAYSAGLRFRWSNGRVPYRIDPSADSFKKDILAAIDNYHANTGIRFVTRTTEPNFITVRYLNVNAACGSSELGQIGGEQYLSLYSITSNPDYCPSATGSIIHEFGHALGLFHEHMREDRDNFITLDPMEAQYNSQYKKQVYFGEDIGAYDLFSIMHYSPDQSAFANPAFTRKDGGDLDNVGQRVGLSEGDISGLATLYSTAYIEQPEIHEAPEVALSSTSITFDLVDHSTNEDGFRVELWNKTGVRNSSWKVLASQDGGLATGPNHFGNTITANAVEVENGFSNRITFQNLSPGVVQRIRVRAFTNDGRLSSASNQLELRTINPPSQPVNLQASLVEGRVQLQWTGSSESGNSYLISWGLSPTGPWGAEIPANTNPALVTASLVPHQVYYFRVRAQNPDGTSAFSAPASIEAQAITPEAPNAVGAVQTVAGMLQAKIQWNHSGADVTAFSLRRSLNDGAFLAITDSIATSQRSYSDTVPSPGRYSYQVIALHGPVPSQPSALGSIGFPTAPSFVSFTVSSDAKVTLNWTHDGNNLSGFKLEKKTGNAPFKALALQPGANVRSVEDPSVGVVGSTYLYRLTALNGSVSSPMTDYSVVIPKAPALPTSLKVVTASDEDHLKTKITWSHTGAAVTGFMILRSENGAPFSDISGTIGSARRTFTDSTLPGPGTYTYKIRTFNGNRVAALVGPTSLQFPATPTGMSLSVDAKAVVSIAWQQPNISGVTKYRVERKAEGAASFSPAAQVVASKATDKGALQGTMVTYRVLALNGTASTSLPSEEVSISIPYVTPEVPVLSAIAGAEGTSVVKLTWTVSSPPANLSGFSIERSEDGGTTYSALPANIAASAKSYPDHTVTGRRKYSYQIRALNRTKQSAASIPVSITTPFPILKPAKLVLTANLDHSMTVAFADMSKNERGFEIYVSSGNANSFSLLTTIPSTESEVAQTTLQKSYRHKGLVAGTVYYYKVRAIDNGNYSAFTPQASKAAK